MRAQCMFVGFGFFLMSVPILILDMKTDLCITSYWIHIYVTDWSCDAGLQRKRGRGSKCMYTSGSTAFRKHRGHRWGE